jgi:hypothetical protein
MTVAGGSKVYAEVALIGAISMICRILVRFMPRFMRNRHVLFINTRQLTKNLEDKVVLLNFNAHGIIEEERGNHAEFVFSY